MPLIQWIMQNLGGGVPTFMPSGGVTLAGSAGTTVGKIYLPDGSRIVLGGSAETFIDQMIVLLNADITLSTALNASFLTESEKNIYFSWVINSFWGAWYNLEIGEKITPGSVVRKIRRYQNRVEYLVENPDGHQDWVRDDELEDLITKDSDEIDASRKRFSSLLSRTMAIQPAPVIEVDYRMSEKFTPDKPVTILSKYEKAIARLDRMTPTSTPVDATMLFPDGKPPKPARNDFADRLARLESLRKRLASPSDEIRS